MISSEDSVTLYELVSNVEEHVFVEPFFEDNSVLRGKFDQHFICSFLATIFTLIILAHGTS
jgi:hypothetical protein